MKKFAAISVILLGIICVVPSANAGSRTVSVVQNTNPYGYNYNYDNSAYTRELNVIENYLFGKTYPKENTSVRLNRIENNLFNKTYSTMNIASRMNNVLANYRNDSNYNSNYLSNFYNNTTPASRIRNRFIGVPTGVTPQIFNTPFGSNMYPGINRSFTSNRGYMYNNEIPMTTGAGIHILD